VVQHHQPVAQPHGHPHVVLDQEHRQPVGADGSNERFQLGDLLVAQSGKRLIQQQELFADGERPRNFANPEAWDASRIRRQAMEAAAP